MGASVFCLGHLQTSLQAVRFVCARMHPPPLVMPSKFDRETRANILTPTAGMIKLDRDHDRLHMVFSIYARQVLLATCLQELPQAESEGAKAAEVAGVTRHRR